MQTALTLPLAGAPCRVHAHGAASKGARRRPKGAPVTDLPGLLDLKAPDSAFRQEKRGRFRRLARWIQSQRAHAYVGGAAPSNRRGECLCTQKRCLAPAGDDDEQPSWAELFRWQELERDPTVMVMGEDVGHYGGSYKVRALVRLHTASHFSALCIR
jgi:hypothetical protein